MDAVLIAAFAHYGYMDLFIVGADAHKTVEFKVMENQKAKRYSCTETNFHM